MTYFTRWSPVAVASALGIVLGGGALADDAPDAETVLATVGGVDITVGHLILSQQALPEQFQALPPETLFDPLLEQLIEQTALMLAGEDAIGFRDRITIENNRRSTIANSVLNRAAEEAITEDSLQVAYDAFVTEFEAEGPVPEYNASHIIVDTEDAAQALRDELDAGADFAELAQEHSTDGAAAGGGALGWFGPGVMIPEFEDAVAEMEVGEIAGPLQTQFGWHLVILNDTRESSAPALDEIRAELEDSIRREAAEAEIARVMEGVEVSRTSLEGMSPSQVMRPELLDD